MLRTGTGTDTDKKDEQYTINGYWSGSYTVCHNTFTTGYTEPFVTTCTLDQALHIAQVKINNMIKSYDTYSCYSTITNSKGIVVDGFCQDTEVDKTKIYRMTEKELFEFNLN